MDANNPCCTNRPLQLAARLVLVTLLFLSPSALTATILIDPSVNCTLINAINAANSDAAVEGCPAGAGADTIRLTGDVVLIAQNNGTNGLPVITSDITIDGRGFTIERDSPASFRIFEVAAGGALTLDQVTVSGGSTLVGGGIRSSGSLTLINSTVSHNMADAGGGIECGTGCSLEMIGSTVAYNTTDPSGGQFGGGISASVADVTLINSTVSNNSGATFGAGISATQSSVTLRNTTVAFNHSVFDGGGIHSDAGTELTVIDSLLFGNTAGSFPGLPPLGGDCSTFGTGLVIDGGGNLGNDGTCPIAGSSLLVGVDPQLADNGGPTQTHALLAGSTAIGHAGSSCLATDQRSAPRDIAGCDSGAVEFGPPATTCPCPANLTGFQEVLDGDIQQCLDGGFFTGIFGFTTLGTLGAGAGTPLGLPPACFIQSFSGQQTLEVTFEEAVLCRDLIRQAAAGVPCSPF